MRNNKGFTSLELFLSLIILASIFGGIIHFATRELDPVKGAIVAEDAVDYARQSTAFIKAYSMAFEDALTTAGNVSNGNVITIPLKVLQDDGFMPNNYPNMNKLHQYPCIVVTYGDHQLEAYLYYRNDSSSKSLSKAEQIAGREHVGGMIGLYQDGNVQGAGNTWNLDSSQTKNLFVAVGSTEPNIGFDTGQFKCSGNEIANNSFVINYASLLSIKNRLPNDDALSQYPDSKSIAGSINNHNTMSSDLNMDGDDRRDHLRSVHAMVFQMNPDCVMDPKNKATMQDYDPNADINNGASPDSPNSLGCKNRQLSIRANSDNNTLKMLITGFQQGGDPVAYVNYFNKYQVQRDQPFVGELKAQSFQATTPIAVGTPCDEVDIGTMAKQQLSGIKNDVNSLYVSQVICMKNPLCPASSDGICFMPANSVTITYQIPIVKNDKPEINKAAINAIQCPRGMAMVSYTDDHLNPPDWGRPCCQSVAGVCTAHAEAHDHVFDGYDFSLLSNTAANVAQFKNGVKLGLIHYKFTCDAACNCPGGDAAQWQPQVTSITCSNDINRTPIQIYQ